MLKNLSYDPWQDSKFRLISVSSVSSTQSLNILVERSIQLDDQQRVFRAGMNCRDKSLWRDNARHGDEFWHRKVQPSHISALGSWITS